MVRRSLVRQPVGQAACRIALTHLNAVRDARVRLKDAGDAEALHDFRVALRRTRSVLRAYRHWLSNIPRRLRRRLRALARATNAARDTEVMMDWLRAERRKIQDKHRSGFVWLQTLLNERYEESYAEITHEVLKESVGMEERLRALLTPIAKTDRKTVPFPPYAVVTADLIRRHLTELAEHLAEIRSVEDVEAIHAARIRGKRLRYLIEPLVNEVPSADTIVRRMKLFQDRFGILCDAFVQAREIVSAVEIAGVEAARGKSDRTLGMKRSGEVARHVLPGLLTLALRLQVETRRRYAIVERYYLGGRADHLLNPVGLFADALNRHEA